MRLKILAIGLALWALPCAAFSGNSEPQKHQLRVGWGDMLFETLAFHSSTMNLYPENTHDYKYSGHIFGEYRYNFNKVTSLGLLADFESICWTVGPDTPSRNYNLTLLPNVRFTYLNKEWVKMYSGVGIGALAAFDNQRNIEAAPAFNLNALGVQVGKGHWSGAIELGFMAAMRGADCIYMLGSRLVSVSLNYSW